MISRTPVPALPQSTTSAGSAKPPRPSTRQRPSPSRSTAAPNAAHRRGGAQHVVALEQALDLGLARAPARPGSARGARWTCRPARATRPRSGPPGRAVSPASRHADYAALRTAVCQDEGLAFDSGPRAWQGSRPSSHRHRQRSRLWPIPNWAQSRSAPPVRASSTTWAAARRTARSAAPSSTPKRRCATAASAPARPAARGRGRRGEAGRGRRRGRGRLRGRGRRDARSSTRCVDEPRRGRRRRRGRRTPRPPPPDEALGVDFAEEEDLEEADDDDVPFIEDDEDDDFSEDEIDGLPDEGGRGGPTEASREKHRARRRA